MCRKVFVDVNADFKADGTIIPLSIKWEDGTVYTIDSIDLYSFSILSDILQAIGISS